MKNYMMETTYQKQALGLNKPWNYEVYTSHNKHLRGCPGFVKRFDNKEDALEYSDRVKQEWHNVQISTTGVEQ